VRVYIANFGVENHLWPTCLKHNIISTYNDKDLQSFWSARDRIGYVTYCLARKKTNRGITPTKPVASRWFSILDIVCSTAGDIWIHREKNAVWWTTAKADDVEIGLESMQRPAGRSAEDVFMFRKPCDPWSDRDRRGNRFVWDHLHPRARQFLFTEGTLQQLADDNAQYALSLLEGADLSPWHKRSTWKAKEAGSGKGAVKSYDGRQKAVIRMVQTAIDTVAGANGQQALHTVKNKELLFSRPAFESYVLKLVDDQDGVCAITGLQLQFDGEHNDKELLCSLDRIDSSGPYAEGNLQVICRFVNRWKSDQADSEFRRLLKLTREVAS
jgi:hypothetical protein